MSLFLVATLLFALSMSPLVYAYFKKPSLKRAKLALGLNISSVFSLVLLSTILGISHVFAAEAGPSTTGDLAKGLICLAAALVTSVSGIGGGIAVASAASAALGALSENEKVFGKAIIIVVLAEGIALYGLLIAFLILGKI